MKRYWNIYEKIWQMDNLKLAHRMARKDKQLYKEVQMVNGDEEYYLTKIQELLKNKKYYINASDYSVSVIRDKTKSRELRKLKYYPHRIIQRAIMLQLEKIFENLFCDFVCASVKGRWWKQVMKLMDQYMKDREWTKYCLKIDIQKFYPSVNHRILKKLLRKKFKDRDLLNILDMIIDSFPWKFGVPIWSYLSQFLANFYLAYFDHWMKEKVRCKYMIRYMDDIVILDWSKKHLRYVYKRMKAYLGWNLGLKIKSNYQIFPTNVRWVDFVWYRYFYWYRLLRKRTCNRMKKKISNVRKRKWREKDWCMINSYAGWLCHCNSYRLYEKYIEPRTDWIVEYYRRKVCSEEKRVKKFEEKVKKLKWIFSNK